jgi:hypothetical protein
MIEAEARGDNVHPAYIQVLRWFAYDHLPSGLKEVSAGFAVLARLTARQSVGPEGTVALRKLLEAKDAAVRAFVQARDEKEKRDDRPTTTTIADDTSRSAGRERRCRAYMTMRL